MSDIEKFVAWIKTKGGQRGLAAAFSKKFPKEKPLSQTTISNWVTRRSVPIERRAQLEALGWGGPWEWPEETKEAAPAAAPYLTEEKFAEWRGYWRKGMEDVLARVKTLEDQVQKLRQQAESE